MAGFRKYSSNAVNSLNSIPTPSLLDSMASKIFLWENLVMGGKPSQCIFPSPPRSVLGPFKNLCEWCRFLFSPAPARSLPCALKYVDKDVNKYVRDFKRLDFNR